MLVTVALLAAVTVALAGLGFYFLHDSKSALNASAFLLGRWFERATILRITPGIWDAVGKPQS
jgi:hypothetical protein